jgi:signal peptidase I
MHLTPASHDTRHTGRKFLRWTYVPHETRQSYILICLLCWSILSFVLISNFVLGLVEVQGESMETTLYDGDRRLVNRCIYLWRAPRRGETVVIRDGIDHSLCVKRIVGVPEDRLEIHDGKVFINGAPLKESYLPARTTTQPRRFGRAPVRIGRDQFFVLGDNRQNSEDSRSYGPVHRSDVLGLISP